MNQRKKLPIGKSTFRDIRDPQYNFAYVDKTPMAYQAISDGFYYFLSRPRRFGKSLFLDTLSEIFKGSKTLFEGLYIYDKWDWSQQFPVIKIDLGSGEFNSTKGILHRLESVLNYNCELLDIPQSDCYDTSIGEYLSKLVRRASAKYNQKVVILIDEYDKPILDNITNPTIANEARDILRNFYSAIKISDAHLRFVFITGVSKFSKLNLFSGLNNLNDITLHQRYSTITGYTHNDIITTFSSYLEGVNLEKLQKWYNGYNYFGEPVYNPFDVLLFFDNQNVFRNYWWQTGNPNFLIEKLRQKPQFLPQLENVLVDEETLNTFDVEHIELTALLWQTGYLTFAEKTGESGDSFYRMKVPNIEVQKSLNHLFLNYLSQVNGKYASIAHPCKQAIRANNIEAFREQLHTLFAGIPNDNYTRNTISNFEGYYASVVFAFLASLGFQIVTEDHTNHGRIDMTLITETQVLLLEFKVDMPAEAALHQIKTKRYYEKYTAQNKTIYLIGIHFDSKERNIVGFEWETK